MSRVQLALNVPDIDEAVDFYSKLFATEPAKRKPGYANFAIADPPLKLVLFEKADADARLNHLGVEVMSTDEVAAHQARLTDAGLATGRRERHLLLRQAGQGLGRRPRRRVGDLHRARGQRHLRRVVGHVDDAGDSLCCATVPEAEPAAADTPFTGTQPGLGVSVCVSTDCWRHVAARPHDTDMHWHFEHHLSAVNRGGN